MKIIHTSAELKHWFKEHKIRPMNDLGFVPTMGALHVGHASLIARATKECEKVIVSILVNPTQFNEKGDLDSYPRNLEEDAIIAKEAGCDVIFAPSPEDLYGGEPSAELVDWGDVTNEFEGKSRPGHFDGVIAVVDKFFQVISPKRAYFGAKDLQQVAVVYKMAQIRHPSVEVVECDLVRDSEGLALSSRNSRLSKKGLKMALELSLALRKVKDTVATGMPVMQSVNESREALKALSELEIEYFDGVNNLSFSSSDKSENWTHIIVAAWVEGVRLIDNIRL
ncbi:MAG: pantoate--beta-alanine ligase [Bacteroidetes bacterium]|nr:MAG: pantoate--beta-alanine ligase [Bacteroidota bacterium]